MEKKDKKKINIYRVAGKLGKGVKKYGGLILPVAATVLVKKGPEIIKKIKK